MKKITKILLPTDFSEVSKEAAEYALMLGRTHGCPLRVLHVVDTAQYMMYAPQLGPIPVMVEDVHSSANQKMRTFVKQIGNESQVTSHVESTTAGVAATICEDAKKSAADLIVMATHGRKGMERFILGSVAERVARTAPCPVLLVRTSHESKV